MPGFSTLSQRLKRVPIWNSQCRRTTYYYFDTVSIIPPNTSPAITYYYNKVVRRQKGGEKSLAEQVIVELFLGADFLFDQTLLDSSYAFFGTIS